MSYSIADHYDRYDPWPGERDEPTDAEARRDDHECPPVKGASGAPVSREDFMRGIVVDDQDRPF